MKATLTPFFRSGFAAAALLCVGMLQAAESPKVFYGLLHAHTFFSDGQGTPEEAFQAAKAAGLDFFAVTPHNHAEAESDDPDRKDNILIANNHALYNSATPVTIVRKFTVNNVPKTETLQVKSIKQAALDATDASFVALYGQEFSTISSGNHVNVFEFNDVIQVSKGHFKDFYDLLKNDPATPIVQLNHPNVQSDLFYKGSDPDVIKDMFNDYGIDDADYGPGFANLINQTDKFVRLIEMLSGPALSPVRSPTFRYKPHDDDYHFYLTQGYHVSPTAGQDNHFKTWGTITDARTGVFAKSRSKADLLDALRSNRTFATEDKNLELSLQANNALFMGDNTNAPTDTDLTFTVTVKDADEPSAAYEITLFGGTIHPETRTTATDVKPSDGFLFKLSRSGNGSVTFQPVSSTSSPQFFYAFAVQNGGDRAWTAPIWVNHPKVQQPTTPGGAVPPSGATPPSGTVFFWSSSTSSKVFHKKGCPSIKLINRDNLVFGTTPPPERHLHNCSVPPPTDNH